MDDAPATRVTTGLHKLGLALRHQAWAEAGPQGLTPTQSQILAALQRHDGAGLALKDLAAELALTPPTLSRAVATLEDKGLVSRQRDAADARRLVLRPTAAGRRLARTSEAPLPFVGEALELLGDDDQAALLRGLTAMIRALQLRGEISTARLCVGCTHFRPHVHADEDAPHHCAFVDAAFGDRGLQLDCPDHDPADDAEAARLWDRFASADTDPHPGR